MIAIASSTRADWGLLTPLAVEMRNTGIPHVVLASNMHLMPEMGMTVDEIRAAGEDPVCLTTAAESQEETFANTAAQYGGWFRKNRPDAVVILGDRYEMLAVASTAVICGIPIVHIAGGTVSEGAMDDSIRNAISQLATLHFAETDLCAERLRAMGIKEDAVKVCGALGVYNALHVPLMSRKDIEESLGVALPARFFVGTLHAATLDEDTPEQQMCNFLDGLGDFLCLHPDFGAILTYPNNDMDPAPLIALLKEFATRHTGRIVLVPSLGMRRYLSAVALSEGVIGNSSSGVVEVASLGVPVLDIGIRQKGRERAASVFHTPKTRHEIAESIERITSPEAKAIAALRQNPYYRPDTPELMARLIKSMIQNAESRAFA